MALMKSKTVPSGAVEMNELEATSYAWNTVKTWGTLSDTWALLYAPAVLGGLNALCGVIINRHFRLKVKLGSYGYFSSVVPISMLPGGLTTLYHRHIISTDILLIKNEACPICYELKAAVIQCGFGIAYPMVLGPAAALMFANRYSTYRVPDLFEGPKVMFQFLRKMTRPFTGTLVTMTVVQLIASSVLTYFEMRNNFMLRRRMLELENKVMAERGLDAS